MRRCRSALSIPAMVNHPRKGGFLALQDAVNQCTRAVKEDPFAVIPGRNRFNHRLIHLVRT